MFRLLPATPISLAADAPAPKAWDKADLAKVPTGWKSLATGETAATKRGPQADDKKNLVLTRPGASPNPVFDFCSVAHR